MSDDTARLRRAIFGECKRRGLDDEARRAVQSRVLGKPSIKHATDDELRRVLREIRAPQRRRRPRPASAAAKPAPKPAPPGQGDALLPAGSYRSKLRALWICAYELQVVDNPTDAALATWICRQTGMDAARWATTQQCNACIEALKDWMARDGGVNWRSYAGLKGRTKQAPRARVLEALWRKLHAAGAVRIADDGALASWVEGFRRSPEDYIHLPGRVQDQLIRHLGAWLRRATE